MFFHSYRTAHRNRDHRHSCRDAAARPEQGTGERQSHRLRGESLTYRGVVEALVDYPKTADTRDTEAVLRIATAYLRLLFPHVRDPKDIVPEDFRKWCLEPAVAMRAIIRRQLQLIDPKEFGGKDMANYAIR